MDNFRTKVHVGPVPSVKSHGQNVKSLTPSVTFEKLKFPMFMHIKPLDDAGLEEMTPVVWWDMTSTVRKIKENVYLSLSSLFLSGLGCFFKKRHQGIVITATSAMS